MLPTAVRAGFPGFIVFFSVVAFALAICCLLAGRDPNTLPNMELFTLNTSRIGAHIQQEMGLPPPNPDFNFSSILPRDITDNLDKAKDSLTKQGSDILGDAGKAIKDPKKALDNLKANITSTISDGKKALESAASKVKDKAKNATSEIVSTAINETISTLNIHDFYTAHLTTWCEGTYKDGKGKKDITYCSNGTGKNSTNATSTKEHDGPFAFIHDLHLPDPIALGMGAITFLADLIAFLYAFALFCLFIAVVTASCSAFHAFKFPTGGSPKLRTASFALTILAFLFLLLGAILARLLAGTIVKVFDGDNLGIKAQMGTTFLRMSYAALGFTGAAVMIAWVDWWLGNPMERAKGLGGKVFERLWHGQKRGRREKQHYPMEEY